jgi:hypothetical protein
MKEFRGGLFFHINLPFIYAHKDLARAAGFMVLSS